MKPLSRPFDPLRSLRSGARLRRAFLRRGRAAHHSVFRAVCVVLLAFLAALPLSAADFELGMRHLILSSSESDSLELADSRGFAAIGEVFFTPAISAQFAAASAKPQATLGGVDVGTMGIESYSGVLRLHVLPRHRLSAYAGGGAAIVRLGDLDDQIGDAIDVHFEGQTAVVAEAGLRYRLLSNIYIDAGVIYMPVKADSRVGRSNVAVPPRVELEPMTISISGSWRF